MPGELNIVAACLADRKTVSIVEASLDLKKEFTSQARAVYSRIKQWYKDDPDSSSVDTEMLKAALARENKRLADKLTAFVDVCAAIDVSVINVQREILSTKADVIMQDVGARMINFESYETLAPDLEKLKELYSSDFWGRDLSTHEFEVYTNENFVDLIKRTDKSTYLPLYPTKIGAHLGGGVWKKSSTVIFGRPDVGKTTFVVNLSCGFINNKYKVLYMANEDAVEQLLLRHVQCLTGVTKDAALEDIETNLAKAEKKGLNNLVLLETPAGTLAHLESLVKEHQPDVLIVDQLRNMQSQVDNRVLQLEEVQRGLRELSKKLELVSFSVTQAGGSADNKAVLNMSDLDWNKTGVQGACDLMIGIGATDMMLQQGTRILSFPKNKINGNKETLDVVFQTDIVRVT